MGVRSESDFFKEVNPKYIFFQTIRKLVVEVDMHPRKGRKKTSFVFNFYMNINLNKRSIRGAS